MLFHVVTIDEPNFEVSKRPEAKPYTMFLKNSHKGHKARQTLKFGIKNQEIEGVNVDSNDQGGNFPTKNTSSRKQNNLRAIYSEIEF